MILGGLATSARGAWLHDGRCVVPAASRAVVKYVGPEAHLVAHRVPCYQAAFSASGMIAKAVQYTRPPHFVFVASGARWHHRWACSRSPYYVQGGGPVALIRCREAARSIRFYIYP